MAFCLLFHYDISSYDEEYCLAYLSPIQFALFLFPRFVPTAARALALLKCPTTAVSAALNNCCTMLLSAIGSVKSSSFFNNLPYSISTSVVLNFSQLHHLSSQKVLEILYRMVCPFSCWNTAERPRFPIYWSVIISSRTSALQPGRTLPSWRWWRKDLASASYRI